MADLFENPIGTNGFEFIEFTGKDIPLLEKLMDDFGFTAVARHKTRNITLYQQKDIKFLLNRETDGQSGVFAAEHNGGASAVSRMRQPPTQKPKNAAQRLCRRKSMGVPWPFRQSRELAAHYSI